MNANWEERLGLRFIGALAALIILVFVWLALEKAVHPVLHRAA